MNQNNTSLEIGLLENCCHSLKRGYELWNEGQKNNDGWLLKEAIFWVHHGIELGLKRLLVQTNEYLVFSDVDKAVTKLREQRKKNKSKASAVNYGALDLFEMEDSPLSVGFKNLIERAAIMLNLSQLEEDSNLRKSINVLTNYRNKITHFSIKLEINEVANLLSEILDPLLELLEQNINDSSFTSKCIPEIREKAQPVQEASNRVLSKNTNRIMELISLFRNQKVNGNLFGIEDEAFSLPEFTKKESVNKNQDYGVDIIAETKEQQKWLIEIKSSDMLFLGSLPFKKTTEYGEEITKWLVIMKPLPPQRIKKLADMGLLVSSLNEINGLQAQLSVQS